MPKNGKLAVFRVFILSIRIGIAEDEVATFPHPNRPFCELKALRQFEDLRIGSNNLVDRGIVPNHFYVYFTRRDGNRAALSLVEIEPRQPHPDEIGRRIGERTIGAENGKLDLLTGLHIAPDDEPVR